MNKLDIIKSFEGKKILLIGDAILDVYHYGRAIGQSLDSPSIEAEETRVAVSFGGASSVASHILELGGSLVYFSVIGDDEPAEYYNSFARPNLNKNFLIDPGRKTTVKRRFWIDGYKLLQVNQVDNRDINEGLEKKVMGLMEPYFSKIDLVVVLDARHGLLTKNLINKLIELSRKYQKPLYVDSQISHRPSNHYLYKGADCLFFSENEAQVIDPDSNINSIKRKLSITNVVVKLGEMGSTALFNNKHIDSLPYQVKAVDTCGAGDAFLATFALGSRDFPEESLAVANIWAALSTTILGTTPPKKKDLINICHD